MKPVTEYGNSYYLYDFAEDKNDMTYADLANVDVHFSNSLYGVDVFISHENGYAGFTSQIGANLYTLP